MSETTYALKHPITQRLKAVGGAEREETIDEVTIRRPKAKDLRALDRQSGKYAQTLALIGTLTGLSPAVVDEIDAEDVAGIGEIVGDFFPELRATGEASSAT